MDRESIEIRAADTKDAEELLDIYAPYVKNTAITFEYEVPSIEEFRERIHRTLKKYPYLIAGLNGESVGYAYASAFHERAAYNWAAEVSIYVKQEKKGLGIGGRLYERLEQILSRQGILNLNACIAWPQEEDEYLTRDSVNFHRHLGYQWVGEFHQCGYKFNRWYNMVWMEKQLGVHLEHQPAVRTFDEIRASLHL